MRTLRHCRRKRDVLRSIRVEGRRLLHLDAQVAVVLQGRHQQLACVPIEPELVHERRDHEVQEDLEDEHDVEVNCRTPRASCRQATWLQ